MTDTEREHFNAGIDAAVRLLEGTAKDFDEMAGQIVRALASSNSHSLDRVSNGVKQADFRSKATLLNGQAMHIRMLKK